MEGGGKGIHCSAQNAALFVDLLQNNFYLQTQIKMVIEYRKNGVKHGFKDF